MSELHTNSFKSRLYSHDEMSTSDPFQDRVSICCHSGRGQPISDDFEDLVLALDADDAEDGVELEQLLLIFVDVLHLKERFH